MQPYTLIMVMFFIIKLGLDINSVDNCFMVKMKNVENVYAPSDSSINNIYNKKKMQVATFDVA